MKARRLWALLLLTLCACGPGGKVTRVADGVRQDGRFIDEVAYTAYARGALLEAAGDDEGAMIAYRAALDSDGDSPEILTRLGAVDCRLRRAKGVDGARPALEAFEEALELDPHYAAAHGERAHCYEALGLSRQALESALLAVSFDPDRAELSTHVAKLLFRERRPAEAWAWLEALVARQPDSVKAWRSFHEAAVAERDATRLRRARLAERALGVIALGEPDTTTLSNEAIDALLRAGDLPSARHAATARRWSAALLAVRAVEIGVLPLALEQAEFVLRADPSNADAWIAGLCASETTDGGPWHDRLVALDREPTLPSPRAALLLERLLERRAGARAAESFREAYARASAR